MNNLDYLKKYYKGNIDEAIQKLNDGIPVQYIVGNVDFYGYNYDINNNVLIPRFETEELVSYTIKYINKYFINKVNILDIGTGSGCIAITLANEVNSNVTGIDISLDALDVAKKNSIKYHKDVRFIQSDVFSNVIDKYDVIISNPPYIRYDEEIMDIVKNNEPHIALYADDKGLYFYKKIISESSSYLNEKNIIAFEIGCDQGKDIISIAKEYYPNSKVELLKDMEGKDRFVFILNV